MFILCLHDNHDDIYTYISCNEQFMLFSPTGQIGIVYQQRHSFIHLLIQQVFIEHLLCTGSWVWFNVSVDSSCPALLITVNLLTSYPSLARATCLLWPCVVFLKCLETCFLRSRHGTRTKTSSLIACCPLHASL